MQFQKQVRAVCDTYLEAHVGEEPRTHTVSSDEMTGIQALERNAPSRPMTYGQCKKIEFEYEQRDVDPDRQLPGVDRGVDRSDEWPDADGGGLASHIEQTVATDPTASWIFVVDNLNIHCSETLVRKVAGVRDRAAVGEGGMLIWVLKSVASRQAFLSEGPDWVRVYARAPVRG